MQVARNTSCWPWLEGWRAPYSVEDMHTTAGQLHPVGAISLC